MADRVAMHHGLAEEVMADETRSSRQLITQSSPPSRGGQTNGPVGNARTGKDDRAANDMMINDHHQLDGSTLIGLSIMFA